MKFCLTLSLCAIASFLKSQNLTRYSTSHQVGWYNYFGTFQLSNAISVHTEYQWRRSAWITQWQQSLLRVGINYHIHPKSTLRIGYGWIETFAYGKIPIHPMGKTFTEHRLFQALIFTDKITNFDFLHRIKFEQRWLGTYSQPTLTQEDKYTLAFRARYMFRTQYSFKKNIQDTRFIYLAAYDEVFIGFGKNVNENVFDQNRLALLIGYQSDVVFKLEGGYFYQILQLGREINNQSIWQYNQGIILNLYIQKKLRKQPENYLERL
ncbi:MAG: DUF2490 domain-containing protein [Cytophagales bacterium]|nr:DUF2490 domain-containing protein [Cytophagales bacterium]MDW8383238.1 DUF2490 domain-containing protein [Flammeovirgaceae bacterium]